MAAARAERTADRTWKRKPSLRDAIVLAVAASVLWLGVRALITLHMPAPEPAIHDAFSYLLGADTFLHGRLANPPHPMGEFFESPHVLIHPTYASKYPPGLAVWFALGKALFGSTYASLILQGFCLIFLLAVMFCVWTDLRVAVFMTFITGCCLLPPRSLWTIQYFGPGTAAAIGAAFVFLGLGHFLHTRKTVIPGILMALGALQLFVTRPYEGGVLCLAVLACMPWFAGPIERPMLGRLAMSAAAILIAGFAWNCYYDRAVTGNPFELPYLLHDKTYNAVPVFCFVPLKPEPKYDTPRLAAQHGLHGWEAQAYRDSCSPRLWFVYTFRDTAQVLMRMLFSAPLILLLIPFCWRDLRCRALLFVSTVCVFSVVIEVWHFPHYLAPAFVAILLFCACSLQYVGGLDWATAAPRRVAAGLLVLSTVAYVALCIRSVPLAAIPTSFGVRRAALIRRLSHIPGQQLLLVHYPDQTACVGKEWVYNGADPDHQKVVFAHDLGPAKDPELFRYYQNRKKWLLTVHCDDYRLEPLNNAVAP